MNLFSVNGVIRSAHIPDREEPSALIVLQYGPQRERQSGRPVEFINAVTVRIPHYRLAKIRDLIVEGAEIEVQGRLQGVLKGVMGEGFITTELVADKVYPPQQFEHYDDEETPDSE